MIPAKYYGITLREITTTDAVWAFLIVACVAVGAAIIVAVAFPPDRKDRP